MSISIGHFENWANQAIATGKNGVNLAARVQDDQGGGQVRVRPALPQALIVVNRLTSGTQEYKTANWNARKAILDMIRVQLGYTADTSIDQFPSGVKDAMKMGAFKRLFFSGDWEQANGRPLTARRIRAIVNAVKAEKAARAEKPVTDLLAVSRGVKGVVNGDEALKQALRNNPEGAAQLCKALRDDKDARDLFVQNQAFRKRILANLRNGCKYPLPTGTFSVPLGRQSLNSIQKGFNKVLQETNPADFENLLTQCGKDLARKGIVITWTLQGETNTISASTENDCKYLLKALMLAFGISDANKAKFLSILHQGVAKETFASSEFTGWLSLPKGVAGGGVNNNSAMVVNFSKTDDGTLKCKMDTEFSLTSLGGSDYGVEDSGKGMMCYVNKKGNGATMKVGVNFDLGTPEEFNVANIEAKEPTVQFSNLRHDVDAYDDIP